MSTKRAFWKNKKVLITGHEGFLGSWLTKVLVENGAKILGVDKVLNRKHTILGPYRRKIKSFRANIAQRELLRSIVKKTKPQFIFHLAAEAIVEHALKDPQTAFQSNIEGTWKLLEAVRGRRYIKAVVIASSDKAYGTHKTLPYKENFSLKGQHPYDVSKSCADLLCQTYYHCYGVPIGITRCGNIFGPGDYQFSRIVPDAVRSVLKGKQLVIRSSGKFTRDYIYVEDVVNAYLLLAERMQSHHLAGEAFNISNERPISVLGLFRKIATFAPDGVKSPEILNQARYEIKHQYLSASKARRILGWRPKYNLDKGLKETIEWYTKNV